MTVSSGNNIAAADYNGVQGRISNILGVGSGQSGYGQSLSSSQVTADVSNVTALAMENLRDDLVKAYQHQFNTNPGLNEIFIGNIVGANASNPTDTVGTGDAGLTDGNKGFNDFFDVMTTLESAPFTADTNQMTPEVPSNASSTRSTAWNGVITHEFTVTFTDSNHRRYFFNTGGQIWFDPELTGGSGANTKDDDWKTILDNVGTIKFAYNSTGSTGSGTGSAIGNYQLTDTYQELFVKEGSLAVYAENRYRIKARHEYATPQEGIDDPTNYRVIRFEIRFEDNDEGDQRPPSPPDAGFVGDAEDEDIFEVVTGTISNTIRQYRATGIYVTVPTPSYNVISDL